MIKYGVDKKDLIKHYIKEVKVGNLNIKEAAIRLKKKEDLDISDKDIKFMTKKALDK